jgi:CheY-like chemotaxis protein
MRTVYLLDLTGARLYASSTVNATPETPRIRTSPGRMSPARAALGSGSASAGFAPSAGPNAPGAQPSENASTIRRTARIVLIDDDSSLFEPLQLLLREALGPDTQLRQERFGTKGVRTVVESEPDLILLDMRLPDVDGLTVLRSIRANPATRDIPIVVITGEAHWQMLGIAVDAGADTYLFKPLRPERFISAVKASYRKRRQPEA